MRRRRSFVGVLLVAIPLVTAVGAAVALSRATTSSRVRPVALQSVQADAVPKGRWRLAAPQELDHVVLFVSHILIRHRESQNAVAPFNPGDWNRLGPPPDRSKDEAQALAVAIATQARTKRDRFEDLVRRYSEDEASRPYGGSLGGVIATDLSPWPPVLDALAVTRPGESSAVVETEFGFHVFQREHPPSDQRVAGRRIAIGYDGTTWLEFAGRTGRATPTRTRERALKLAEEIVQRARRNPGEFPHLVEEFSDHRDAAQGGDLGLWSTHEPTYVPREIQILSGLKPGEISEPVDTRCGVEILQRTDASERPRFAMNAIRIPFEPGTPSTRRDADAAARKLISELRSDPGRLPELLKRYRVTEVEAWTLGRGPFGLTDWLARLEVGQISPSPVESDHTIVVARRIDPAAVSPPRAATFDIPNPATPDLDYFVRSRRGQAVTSLLASSAEEFRSTRTLKPDQIATLGRIQTSLKDTITERQDPVARVAAYRDALAAVERAFGREGLQAYAAILNTRIERALIGKKS